MSLINDALKKAQMEQQGRNAPAAQSPDVNAVASGSGKGPVVAVLALLLVAGVAGGAWYFISKDAGRSSDSAPVETPSSVVPLSEAAAKVDGASAAVPAAGEGAVEVPTSTAAVEATALPVVEPVKPVEPAPVVKPVAPVLPKQDPRVQNLIGVMTLSLVRASVGRCIIDGTVRKVGDRLSDEPLIAVKSIEADAVTLTDGNGVEYVLTNK